MKTALLHYWLTNMRGGEKVLAALGWKVNGAGGDGGSVTLLSGPDKNKRREMLAEINAMGDGVRQIGIRLNESGLRIIRD